MKASVEWLKEYSDIDVDSIKLGDILTMTGSKVETIEQKGNDIKNVVVGIPTIDAAIINKIDLITMFIMFIIKLLTVGSNFSNLFFCRCFV